MMAFVPTLSALSSAIQARQTCFGAHDAGR